MQDWFMLLIDSRDTKLNKTRNVDFPKTEKKLIAENFKEKSRSKTFYGF